MQDFNVYRTGDKCNLFSMGQIDRMSGPGLVASYKY